MNVNKKNAHNNEESITHNLNHNAETMDVQPASGHKLCRRVSIAFLCLAAMFLVYIDFSRDMSPPLPNSFSREELQDILLLENKASRVNKRD